MPQRQFARVAEWQTRTTQNRVPQGMGVRLSPRAPKQNKVMIIFTKHAKNKFEIFKKAQILNYQKTSFENNGKP